jgi:HAD superfamily hydrolase (TIGR01662 family)
MRWFCFDVGETLVDETRVWTTWAEVLGIPAFTLQATMGGCIATGRSHEDAFALLGHPDWLTAHDEVQDRFGAIRSVDLYPDALPALAALRAAGYGIAVIGNQPARRHAELVAAGVEADVMAMSDELGVEKPAPAFFAAVVRRCGVAAGDIAYVGDRLDNDVAPAAVAGLRAVWLQRGPWAAVQPGHGAAAALAVGSLTELSERPKAAWGQAGR